MDFKLVCTFIFLLFLSWGTPLGFSQETEQMDLEKSLDTLEQGLAGILQQVQQQSVAVASAAASQGGASADAMPCMQKLMPCQPFIHSTSPPAICCAPLKDVVTQESQCLCKVFDNPELLKSINLTMEGALALPKACGIDVDVSVCKNATSPGASPPSLPSTSSTSNPGPSTSNISSDSSNTSSSSNSNAGIRIIDAGCSFWYIGSFAALTFSTFYSYAC